VTGGERAKTAVATQIDGAASILGQTRKKRLIGERRKTLWLG
jgi:hypothetical protein